MPTQAEPPVLLAVSDVAHILNCSPRHIYRMAGSGRMPKPVKLGALVRWNRREVVEWLSLGCPSPYQAKAR